MDDLVMEYFVLDEAERTLVEDFVKYVVPSVQPTGYRSIRTPLLERPTRQAMKDYVNTLQQELSRWRKSLGGKGSIHVCLFANEVGNGKGAYRAGPLGTVRISLEGKPADDVKLIYSDEDVQKVLTDIRKHGILPAQITENFFAVPDIALFAGKQIYIVKPLVRRFWVRSSALADAYRLVLYTQGQAGPA